MTVTKTPPNFLNTQLLDLAFLEDLGSSHQDVTTDILFAHYNKTCEAKIISKQTTPIVFCGDKIIKSIFAKLQAEVAINFNYQDGDVCPPGAVLFNLSAPATVLLKAERILLNFLQRLCAIATFTRQFTDRIQHTSAKILDTRKTIPGLRDLEKYAVHCGGGLNHRRGLYDAVMIKDTHIDFLGGIDVALDLLPSSLAKQMPVIVEVRNLQELKIVLDKASHKVTRVLLDNMTKEQLVICVQQCRGRMSTEASGNIHLDNVMAIAETGVDFISIGKLTHSAPHVDLSMQCNI